MKNKTILALVFSLVFVLAAVAVSAIPVAISEVKINGDEVSTTDINRLDLTRGDTIELKVRLSASQDLDDVQVMAFISGFEHSDVEPLTDTTPVFDMEMNVSYNKRLSLDLSKRMKEDNYKLRIVVSDRNGDELVQNYKLKVDVPRHDVTVKDVVFSPESSVQAGRALLATVRVKNTGEQTEEGLKVRVSVPGLGIGASDFIDELKAEESTTSEELFLRVPACASAGTYDVRVTVEFRDGDESVTATRSIDVVDSDVCPIKAEFEGKVTITVSGDTQQVTTGGAGAVYPVTLSNSGATGKTFVLSVDGVSNWGTVRVSPSNVVTVSGGETKSAFVFVTANAGASAGERMFVVGVGDSAGNKLQDITLKANVAAGGSAVSPVVGDLGSARRLLEVGLVVLVVLVVLVGLVVALRRMRGPGEGEESQTYY